MATETALTARISTRAMRTSMTQITSTSTSTRTSTRASCICEHAPRVRSLRGAPLDVCVTRTSWLKMFLSLTSSHLHTWASLFDLDFLPFYFDLTFSVLFHFSVLMHLEQHSELDNLNTMQHNLRTSAKESNDAYDVSVSLTFLNMETLTPVLLMKCLQSPRSRDVRFCVSTVFIFNFLKTEIARSSRGHESQEHQAEDSIVELYLALKISVTW